MRKQNRYIFTGVALTIGIVGLIDYFQQKEKLKRNGQKMNWGNYNGLQAFKKITVFGIVGGIVGNEFYKWEFDEESKKKFSSDNFLKKTLAEENVNTNPKKLQELKLITKEVKATLDEEFYNELVNYPETIGSLGKRTAIATTYDADIVLPIKKETQFRNLSNLSSTIHNKIENRFNGIAEVRKSRKASSLIFQGSEGTHKIDIIYGKETGNYSIDKKLNLYVRPSFFWQKGKSFKTDISVQKNLLINKPRVREVIKLLKVYRDRNNLALENTLIDQLSLGALSAYNYGKEFSISENFEICLDYMSFKLSNKRITDYANSNNNFLNKIDESDKQAAIDLVSSDLVKIESNPHYIKEIFHR